MTIDVDGLVAAWIAAFDRADLGAVRPWCRPDVIVRAPAHADAPSGLDRIASLLAIYRQAFPDGRFELERIDGADPIVSCAWIARGVNRGPFLHFPVTHRDVVVRGSSRFRLVDGLIAELWFTFSLYDVIDQLDGLLPAPGRISAAAEPIVERALTAWIDALSGGPKALEAAFDPDVVVHAQCFGLRLVERGPASLDQVLGIVQSIVADVRISIRERLGQGRTATARARLAGRADGADREWALDCMLRVDADRVVELWVRIEELCRDVD